MDEKNVDARLPDFLIIPSVLLLDKDIQPLDREVYGIVYWASKLKNEKCTLSNVTIAKMINSSVSGVSHSLTRLSRKRYVFLSFDDYGNRKEIVPLIFFRGVAQTSKGVAEMSKGGSSNEQQNNIYNNIEKEKKEYKEKKEKEYPSTENNNLVGLSDINLYKIAQKMEIWIGDVRELHTYMLSLASQGILQKKYKIKNLNLALQNWLRMGLQRGSIHKMDEYQKLAMKYEDPVFKEKEREALKIAKENGTL